MSHELRTPLNSIIGFTEIIKGGRAGPVTDKQAQYLGMAHASARHLLNLINDLLDLSRIESGKDQLFIEAFELRPLVQEALQTVQTAAQSKQLQVHSDLQVSRTIHTDRKKLFQIILNLLSNAVKFTDQGHIDLRARAQNGHLCVTVADTGIGMTAEQVNSLFGEFRRMEHPARRIYEGAGLGLYLSKKLVTLLGGRIWAESEHGKGSRFSFEIPFKPLTNLSHGQTANIAS